MDYKKKYEEALERARALHALAISKGYPRDYVKEYETVFPELAESYDDIIREELVEAFAVYDNDSFWNGIPIKSILAWLKKQKEQNPAEWSEEDEKNFAWFDKFFRAESVVAGGRDIPQDKYLWFKSLKPQPKQEWTEEDEKMLNKLINRINTVQLLARTDSTSLNFSFFNEIGWLKLLRNRYAFKPSKEQIYSLGTIVNVGDNTNNGSVGYHLKSLYEQLKKLMEE